MEMHQVRYFLAVADTLNFTRAAELCNVAQPSLTRAIKKLEDELGGPLFRRERNNTHLTELGQLMRPHLEATYRAAEVAKATAQDYGQLETAPLALGVPATIAASRILDLIDTLRGEVPTLELALYGLTPQTAFTPLIEGKIDVALLGTPEALPDRLDHRPLYTERYVAAFAEGHRFAGMEAVPLAELAGETYLERLECEYRGRFETLFEEQDVRPKARHRIEREVWVRRMVLMDLGVALMPEHLAEEFNLPHRPVRDPEVTREVCLVTVAGRRFSPILQRLVRLVQERRSRTA